MSDSSKQFCALILGIVVIIPFYSSSWTWTIRKRFSEFEQKRIEQQTSFVVAKLDTNPFRQAVLCWNASKPEAGYFSFYVQVRDTSTGKWYEMHHMIDWGADRQRSYFSRGAETQGHHVRVEVPYHTSADGFRIKVVAHEGANLALFHSLVVTISDMTQFNADAINDAQNLDSVYVEGVPCYSQMALNHPRAEVMCSPTSCSMVIGYMKQRYIDSVQFALGVYDAGLDSFGSWPFNIAHAYDYCQGEIGFFVTRLKSFKVLHAYLARNIPVVVSVRGPLVGAAKEYKSGHLLVVVGWDQKNRRVLCHDPAFPTNDDVAVTYDIDDFCRAWARSHCLAYLVEPLLSK